MKGAFPKYLWFRCFATTLCEWADSTVVQSLKAVTAYFSSKQLLPFGFAEQCTNSGSVSDNHGIPVCVRRTHQVNCSVNGSNTSCLYFIYRVRCTYMDTLDVHLTVQIQLYTAHTFLRIDVWNVNCLL